MSLCLATCNLINSPPALLFGRQGPKASISKGSSWKGQNIGKLSKSFFEQSLSFWKDIMQFFPNEPALLWRNLRKRFCRLCRDPSFSEWCQSGPEMQRISPKNHLRYHHDHQHTTVILVTTILITLTPSSSPSSSAAPLFTIQLCSFMIKLFKGRKPWNMLLSLETRRGWTTKRRWQSVQYPWYKRSQVLTMFRCWDQAHLQHCQHLLPAQSVRNQFPFRQRVQRQQDQTELKHEQM